MGISIVSKKSLFFIVRYANPIISSYLYAL